MPRPLLVVLVYALPVLVTTFAVLAGSAALARGAADPLGARVLYWGAMACLIVLAVDLVLLVGALGLRAVSERSDGADEEGGGG